MAFEYTCFGRTTGWSGWPLSTAIDGWFPTHGLQCPWQFQAKAMPHIPLCNVISAHNLGLAGWLDFVSCPKKTRAYQAVRFSWPGWCAIILPAWTYWNSCVILGWFPTYIFEVVCLHVWARLNMEHTSNGNLNGKHVLSVIKLLGIPFSDKPQCCWLYAILSYLNIKCSKALRLSPSIGLIPILSKSHNCWSYPNRPIYYIILYYIILYYIIV